MEKQLEELGLTKNEANIYLFLLKKGSTTTGSIIKETSIANSRVYESLNSLIAKGFVIYNIQKEGKYFQAVSPNVLKEKETERQKKIDSLLPELLKIQSTKELETKTAIYEGFEGFKTAFKKIIDDCPNNETINILGFSQQQYASESLKTFLTNMNLRSAQKKHKLRIIIDKTSEEFQKERFSEKFTEIRHMPKGYISPAAIDIFQDYVYIFLWEEKPFVYMIKNRKIAESFKVYFEFLWKIAKK